MRAAKGKSLIHRLRIELCWVAPAGRRRVEDVPRIVRGMIMGGSPQGNLRIAKPFRDTLLIGAFRGGYSTNVTLMIERIAVRRTVSRGATWEMAPVGVRHLAQHGRPPAGPGSGSGLSPR